MVVFDGFEFLTEEEKRLKEDRERTKYWKKWGPYVAERQWATGNRPSVLWAVGRELTWTQSGRTTAPTETPGAVRASPRLLPPLVDRGPRLSL